MKQSVRGTVREWRADVCKWENWLAVTHFIQCDAAAELRSLRTLWLPQSARSASRTALSRLNILGGEGNSLTMHQSGLSKMRLDWSRVWFSLDSVPPPVVRCSTQHLNEELQLHQRSPTPVSWQRWAFSPPSDVIYVLTSPRCVRVILITTLINSYNPSIDSSSDYNWTVAFLRVWSVKCCKPQSCEAFKLHYKEQKCGGVFVLWGFKVPLSATPTLVTETFVLGEHPCVFIGAPQLKIV